MSLPSELRFNSHFGWDVMPGSELESVMKSEELVMTGPAGKFIVFDGSQLLHRGGLIEAGERIVLQVVFLSKSISSKTLTKRHSPRIDSPRQVVAWNFRVGVVVVYAVFFFV